MVDGLEQQMKGQLSVVKIDTGSDEGARLAGKYQVTMLPTFIVLDAQGRVVYRKQGGRPEADVITKLRLR